MEGSTPPPEGTIALLFTDIEGSTRLAARLASGLRDILSDHDALVGGAIAAEGDYVDGPRTSVAAGLRVARACELARARQPA